MKEIMKAMAERMANKIRLINHVIEDYENKRNCPFYSELRGMEQALKTMGIDYVYEYNSDIKITAVVVMGQRVEI